VPNARTREEAMIALESERRKAFANEYGLLQKPHVVKFSHLMDQYLENYAKINNRAWKRDRDCLKNMEAFFGDCYLKEITPFQIEKYKAHRLHQGVKPSTVNRELSVLKRAFNLAIDWHLAEENPVRRVKFFQQPDPKERVLSGEEEEILINASSGHLTPILIAGLNTGMRVSEILSLKWSQVNLRKREIEVVKTKSGKKRVIPINDALLDMFNRLRRVDDFVFLYHDPKTKKPRPVKSIKRSFTNACRRAGIEAFTFHDTRHTFASRLVERGVDLITVKELLGHSSVRTTERYTHTHKEEKKRAVDVLVKEVVQAENLLTICESAKNTEIGKSFNLLITNN
jgi:integrase